MFDFHALYYSLFCSRRAQIIRTLGVSKVTSRYYIWNSIKILFFLCVYVCFLSNEDAFNPVSDQSSASALPQALYMEVEWKAGGTDHGYRSQQRRRGSPYLVCTHPDPCQVTSLCFSVNMTTSAPQIASGVRSGPTESIGTHFVPHAVLRQLRLSYLLIPSLGSTDIPPLFFLCSLSNPVWSIKF